MTILEIKNHIIPKDDRLTDEQSKDRRAAIKIIDQLIKDMCQMLEPAIVSREEIIEQYFPYLVPVQLSSAFVIEFRNIILEIHTVLYKAREQYIENWLEYNLGAAMLVIAGRSNLPLYNFNKVTFVGSENVITFNFDVSEQLPTNIAIGIDALSTIVPYRVIEFSGVDAKPANLFFDKISDEVSRNYKINLEKKHERN